MLLLTVKLNSVGLMILSSVCGTKNLILCVCVCVYAWVVVDCVLAVMLLINNVMCAFRATPVILSWALCTQRRKGPNVMVLHRGPPAQKYIPVNINVISLWFTWTHRRLSPEYGGCYKCYLKWKLCQTQTEDLHHRSPCAPCTTVCPVLSFN